MSLMYQHMTQQHECIIVKARLHTITHTKNLAYFSILETPSHDVFIYSRCDRIIMVVIYMSNAKWFAKTIILECEEVLCI